MTQPGTYVRSADDIWVPAPPDTSPKATGARRHSDKTKMRAYRMYDVGMSQAEIANHLGTARQTIARWLEQRKNVERKVEAKGEKIARWNDDLPPPLLPDELSPEAAHALEDFEYWRVRYLGRPSRPWQIAAAELVITWIESPDTEFGVINCPPGSGKSTLFTHDIPAWLICRDRTIRILLGHRVATIANTYSARLRRTFQRTRPLKAGAGHPIDATACLAEDYGRFKPLYQEAWRANEWTVMMTADDDTQDESGLEDKEATVTAFGFDSEYLGSRANYVVWDDLVTESTVRTEDIIDKQRRDWESEGETRVEPSGCLILQGQRMDNNDLYAYVLSHQYTDDEDDQLRHRYHHIVYRAHDDEGCKGAEFHTRDAPAWPDGCLLDPERIRWSGPKGLNAIRQTQPAVYDIQYQQKDVSASEILVPQVWIDGGMDNNGIEYQGCWDNFRGIREFPRTLAPPTYSVLTIDPSATNFWAIEWWLYNPNSETRLLVDLHHDRLDAAELLDWNALDGVFYGVLHEFITSSKETPHPITHVIMEVNACQRWLLRFDHTQRWQRENSILVIPHQTGVNKLDPELGIQSIKDRYRFGQVRLPGVPAARSIVAPLVHEATHYQPARPKAIRDDCLMAQWFFEFHAPSLARPKPATVPRLKRPSWMRGAA